MKTALNLKQALSTSRYFDDVISMLNKNIEHARAIEFML